MYWVHLLWVMGAVLQPASLQESIWDGHEATADAITDGNVRRTVKMANEHAKMARQNLLSRLNEVLDAPVAPERPRTLARAS